MITKEILYVHNLESIPEYIPKLNVRILKLDNESIYRINDVKKFDDNAFLERFGRGDECYVTENLDYKIISYHWTQKKGEHFFQQANQLVKLKSDELWIYHVRVKDDYQGKGIGKFVYGEILRNSKKEGLEKVYIYTNIRNISNRKILSFLGFYPVRIYYSVKFKSKYFLIFSNDLEKK